MISFGNIRVTECEHAERFFEGEELSYLWKKPVFDDANRLMNDYANLWTIDGDYVRKNYPKTYCRENPDGSLDVQLIILQAAILSLSRLYRQRNE